MKITKRKLRKIIKEELSEIHQLSESGENVEDIAETIAEVKETLTNLYESLYNNNVETPDMGGPTEENIPGIMKGIEGMLRQVDVVTHHLTRNPAPPTRDPLNPPGGPGTLGH